MDNPMTADTTPPALSGELRAAVERGVRARIDRHPMIDSSYGAIRDIRVGWITDDVCRELAAALSRPSAAENGWRPIAEAELRRLAAEALAEQRIYKQGSAIRLAVGERSRAYAHAADIIRDSPPPPQPVEGEGDADG